MKYIICFILGAMAFMCTGQDNEAEKIVYGNPFAKGNQDFINMLNKKKSGEEVLSQFLFKNWQEMSVVGVEEDYFFKVDSANFHIPSSQVIFYKDGEVLKVYEKQVKEVKIKDVLIKSYPVGKRNAIFYQFFEVLHEGKYSLLRNYKIVKKSTTNHPMGIQHVRKKEIKKKEILYYYCVGDEVKEVSKKKSKFLKIFKGKSKRVKNYAKDFKLSLNSTDDIIRMFNYYNSIVSSDK